MTAESQPLARYWGKADPTLAATGRDHHTVLGHSLDVAACAFVLVEHHPTLNAQLGRRSGLPEHAVASTFAAVCALHDIGKLDTRFQRKAAIVADHLRPESSTTPPIPYDHGTEGFLQVEADPTASASLREKLGLATLPLLRAVCGHHGSLPTPNEPDPSRSSLKPSLRREDEAARRLFIEVVLEFFTRHGAHLPWPADVDGCVVQSLGGLCAVADWVGSNVEHFPYETAPSDLDAYWSRAKTRAFAACDHSGLIRARQTKSGFADLFPGYVPRDVQTVTESLQVTDPALIIVEAEMGKGKTEAALSLAAGYLARGVCDGITIALPTMATSNAMFERVEDILPRMVPGENVQLALAHGRSRRQLRFQQLVQRGLQARDVDAPEASVSCARWLLGRKRILLAQVGVGTIDQALQAALVVRHQFVRMFGLSRNVVIVDEVHAYDAYMEVLLEHLLSWLGALGVPVILLSATLPSERRAALARAWRTERSEKGGGSADDLSTARSTPYPMVSVTTTAGTRSYTAAEPPLPRTLLLERAPRGDDEQLDLEQVAQRLALAASSGARVVWIRNTVREAQRAFAAVTATHPVSPVTLFHARFRGCDRSEIERQVLAAFGKRSQPGGRVLIATQVVEQSLDLDFDELHTDLAPVDLILQRAGRLHRHVRLRPDGFAEPRLVVHVPSEKDASAFRFGPSRYVYDVGTLWITNRALSGRGTLVLPNDIRGLVEECYHPASRAELLSSGGSHLVAAEQRRELDLLARRTKAKQCCIPPTSAEPDGVDALPDDEDAVQAFTRDGSSVTLLPFWWDGVAARALDATPESPEWNLDADSPRAWQLASDLLDQTLSLPARSTAEGLPSSPTDAWPRWRKKFSHFADDAGLGKRVIPLPLKRDGHGHRGWLRLGSRTRRVLYSKTLGLFMPSEKGEEEQR